MEKKFSCLLILIHCCLFHYKKPFRNVTRVPGIYIAPCRLMVMWWKVPLRICNIAQKVYGNNEMCCSIHQLVFCAVFVCRTCQKTKEVFLGCAFLVLFFSISRQIYNSKWACFCDEYCTSDNIYSAFQFLQLLKKKRTERAFAWLGKKKRLMLTLRSFASLLSGAVCACMCN